MLCVKTKRSFTWVFCDSVVSSTCWSEPSGRHLQPSFPPTAQVFFRVRDRQNGTSWYARVVRTNAIAAMLLLVNKGMEEIEFDADTLDHSGWVTHVAPPRVQSVQETSASAVPLFLVGTSQPFSSPPSGLWKKHPKSPHHHS